MKDSYLVPARDGEAEIEVRNSRFRCTIRRVASEEAAREVVAQMRHQHWDARHHCSAFVVGPQADLQRSSDDGEPAGTAGAPMLEVLRGAELSDVVAVVTRWFGGTLLGAGGLVRAYSDSVREAVAVVGTRRRVLVEEHRVLLEHAVAAKAEAQIRAAGVDVLDVRWAEQHVEVLLGARPSAADVVAQVVARATHGSSSSSVVGSRWIDTDEGASTSL